MICIEFIYKNKQLMNITLIEESEIMAYLGSIPDSYLILLAILILTIKGLLPGFPFSKEVLIIYLG